MTRNQFMEFMEQRFELSSIARNLLNSIWYEHAENPLVCNNIAFYRVLYYAFGSDLTDEEYVQICGINEENLMED